MGCRSCPQACIVIPSILSGGKSWRGVMAATPVSLQHHFADLIDPRSERSCRTNCSTSSASPSVPSSREPRPGRPSRRMGTPSGTGWPSSSACPMASPRMIPSDASSACWIPRRSSAASPTRSRPWRRAAWGTDGSSRSTARRYAGADAAGWGWRRCTGQRLGRANHVSLGQVAVDDKSNEITAIPRLLELLDLSGAW